MALTRRWLLAGSAALVASSSRRAWASDPLDDLLARVARARAPVRTLRGPFTQTRTIGLLAVDVRSTGTLTLVRPDRLRWALAAPDEATFFIGPEGVAFRGPAGGSSGAAQTVAPDARMTAALDDLRTLLGGDLGKLRARWDLRTVRDDASGAELQASPRPGAASPLRSLDFTLGPDLVRPLRAVLTEGPHDRTLIEFGALTIDAPVDPAVMRP